MQKFSQKVYRVGMDLCVEVPPAASKAFAKRGKVPVTGTLNGLPIRATLVPVNVGRHRLYISKKMCGDAGLKAGDLIELVLEIDTEPREQTAPAALEAALEVHSRAKARFNSFPPSYKKEVLTYLNAQKTPEALKSNIDKLITKLEEG